MNKKSEAGFSLIEVIVALVILMVIVFPFMTSYTVSTKLNAQSDLMKRATDAVELAQKDIRTWDEDVLEALANSNKEWAYLNTKNNDTLYSAFRRLLDDNTIISLDNPGEPWGEGLDVKFKVEKDLDYEDVTNQTAITDLASLKNVENDDFRKGYNLYIRVAKDGIKFYNDSTIVTNTNNNDGRGYYMDITLGNASSSYNLRKIPDIYVPLEKLDAGISEKIVFGGEEWIQAFKPTAGDVALIYMPRITETSRDIKKAFDISGSTIFGQTDSDTSWENIASYLNNEFYNSLSYNQYSDTYNENYYSSKSWIKKHTWLTGPKDNLANTVTTEYVGLLNYGELGKLKYDINNTYIKTGDSFTLTPNGNKVYLADLNGLTNNTVSSKSPTEEHYIFPVIYLDKDLYSKKITRIISGVTHTEYILYEPQEKKLKDAVVSANNTVISKSNNLSKITVLIQFDDDLTEKNFEDEYYEKLRLLVNITDNRTNKNANGVIIYTINNRDVGNYSWLNLQNASKTTDFKVVDSIYMEEEYDNTYSINDSLKRVFKVNGYKITTWAEYMGPDEYRGSETAKKNEHEKLILYINKEKEIPTFQYEIIQGENSIKNEVDNNKKDNLSKLKE